MNKTNPDLLTLSEALLEQNQEFRLLAKGLSMRPNIREGDFLYIQPVKGGDIQNGDIIFFRDAGQRPVIHRVVKKDIVNNETIIFTQGDAMLWAESLNPNQVLGKVKLIERAGRKIDINSRMQRAGNFINRWRYRLFLKTRNISGRILSRIQGGGIYGWAIKKIVMPRLCYSWRKNQEGQNILEAKVKDKIIACLKIEQFPEESLEGFWIFGLQVNWAWRRLGIASTMVKAARDMARTSGQSKVRVFVFADNQRAIKLYEKAGFHRANCSELEEWVRGDEGRLRQKIVFEAGARNESNLSGQNRPEEILKRFVRPDFRISEYLFEPANFDWDVFFKTALDNKLAPFVYRQIEHDEKIKNAIPPRILSKFRNSYLATAAYNSLILDKLKTILNEFKRQAIRSIVLKGPALIALAYKDVGLRPMGDLDILIEREQLPAADEALRTLGYQRPVNYDDALNVKAASSANSLKYKLDSEDNFFVHLHWHIINCTWPLGYLAEKIDMRDIFGRATDISIDGTAAKTLAPAQLILHLMQHSITHLLSPLILFKDITVAVEMFGEKMDWHKLQETAQAWQMNEVLDFCRNFIAVDFGYDIKFSVNARPQGDNIAVERMRHWIKKYRNNFYFLCYRIYLGQQKGIMAKLRFLIRTVFPPAYVIASGRNLPCRKIGITEYWQRIKAHVF
ncbi:MAG: signal peptidase I [Candidatus Omnitrophica bacterium]|nr:signal peptidase I [Candidatus Omnitrophota bacterium]MBU1924992.1 signal peptidase I [Candidatus Omnitrophota bacterium]